MKAIFTLGIMVALLGAFDPFERPFSEFRSSLEKNEYIGAYKSLRTAMAIFWSRTPLLLQNVQFVKSEDNSYGIYEPRDGETFVLDEIIYLYMEPIGYTLKRNQEGYYEFGFNADFILEDENGTVLGGQNDFATPHFNSWNFNSEVSLTFNYILKGLTPGKYKIVTHVRDALSDQKATIEKWVTIQ